MGYNYSVAIKLSVTNLASKGLKILAGDLIGANKEAVKLQDRLSALKVVAAGFVMSKAGDDILGFLGKATKASSEYAHQIALMKAAGFTQAEVARSVASAWKTTGEVVTTTAADNLAAIRELRSAFGKGEGMAHAYAVLPQVQRAASILESLTGRAQEHVGFDMVKAIELGTKGALTVESMMRQSEMMTKALVQMQGTLNVADFHQTLKYSRAMAPYMSDEFKYLYLPTLMQEMKAGPSGGASSAGNVIASLGQVIVGQQIPKALIANWISAGLIKPGMVVADKHNRTTSKILPGGVAGQNEFGINPYFWAQKYAAPAVEKLMRDMHLDQYGAILALTHNRVAAFGLQTLINKAVQFERDAKLIREGPKTLESYQSLLKLDPQMAQKALESQWQNILSVIGYRILPKLLPLMVKFADSLNALSTWMSRHPNMTSGLIVALGLLGVALSLAGKATMILGVARFLGLAGAVGEAGAAAGVAGAGIAGLTGLLWPLIPALAAVAAAIGIVMLASGERKQRLTAAQSGEDVFSSNRPTGYSKQLRWIRDAGARLGNYGHWEGVGSGMRNAYRGPSGEMINPDYRVDRNVLSQKIDQAVGAAGFSAKLLAMYGNKGVVPSSGSPKQPVTIITKIDSRDVSRFVIDDINKATSRPSAMNGTFDPNRNMPTPAWSGRK